ncbi:hypothetical protein Acr_10g0002940 [Actinidia rufa]|uniref:Retrotransposon Copia-like N-terminal domain-containing protein n=1 Tax=Actinidia rufa TaxID=165716 RepID=A0A7J0F9L4_9ERIC|nr:hypothetical protein Acr_10g0002940 [Actinidia rufa]
MTRDPHARTDVTAMSAPTMSAATSVPPRQRRHVSTIATSAIAWMAQPEVSQPISIILDDSNYRLWSSAMQRFLRAIKLWKYITGDAQSPHFFETDDDDDDTLHIQYQSQLEDWDSVNSKIITWFSNTSVSSIHLLFTPFETAKEVWDYLAERYSSVDGANEYQLGLELHHLRFDSGQTLIDFYNKLLNLWNHLAQFEPTETCLTDDDAFYAYRDRSRLRHFLMALSPDYEHIRASLLHRHPLPAVGQALAELRSEETRKKTMVYQHSQPILETPVWAPLQPPSQSVRVLAQKIYHLDLSRNIAAFVDETLTLMKIVALAPSPNARGTTTVKLLLSLTLLGRLLTLLLPPLLLLMSRP